MGRQPLDMLGLKHQTFDTLDTENQPCGTLGMEWQPSQRKPALARTPASRSQPIATRSSRPVAVQIGTPQYMAPEMHAGRSYTFAADVWSLGCLLYELCALQPLFQDREEEAVARKVGFVVVHGLVGWPALRVLLAARAGLRHRQAARVRLVLCTRRNAVP